MRNKNGFTLVEVIVAIALIGIIAVGIIPAFAAQYKMTLHSKSITVSSFEAQGGIERDIEQTRSRLIDGSLTGDTSFALFGKTVSLYKLISPFPSNDEKNYVVYLSQMLAQMEQKQLLVAGNVSIEISGETVHQVADLKKSPKPTLVGVYGTNTDPKWYANLYRWYVSEEGKPSPKFPDDFERITFVGVTPPVIDDLSTLANRYVVFTVTPVDIHGVRGNEVRSTNTVYILGPEWRSGIFAWVDKDNDINFDEAGDVKVEKSLTWPLIKGFDTQYTFPNPANPDEQLDPKNGTLYVPMGIDRTGTNRVGPIIATGSDQVEWVVDKSIHLATDISVNNASDLHFMTRTGNITLYQYIELDSHTGDAVFVNGQPKLVPYGPTLSTQIGDIIFDTEGRGDVTLQEYSTLDSAGDIKLLPYGHINLYKSNLIAGGSIRLDASSGSLYSGNRDITIQDSLLRLEAATATGRTIRISTRDRLDISDTTIQGNTSSPSRLEVSAPDGITFDEVDFYHIGITLEHSALMKGGGFDASSTITVPDGKTLIFQGSGAGVNNQGSLLLGNTGAVHFTADMATDLANPLTITLSKGSNTSVRITTNYGRNVEYADPVGPTSLTSDFRELGTGGTNLEYAVFRVLGSDSPGLALDFDGTDTVSLYADGTGPMSSYFELQIRDQFADNEVVGSILFRVRAAEGESPVITVVGPAVPTFTVTFDENGGQVPANPATKTVQDGEALGALPSPPEKDGYDFLLWNSQINGGGITINEATVITDNLTAYAQYSLIPVYTVTFDKNGGTVDASPTSLQVIRGSSVGTLPIPPKNPGYQFIGWNTKPDGNGTVFNGSTIVRDNLTVYAQWKRYITYAEIPVGKFISINGTNYQKITEDKVLLRSVAQSYKWNTAKLNASNYYKSFSSYPWIIGSGLLSNATIDQLIEANKKTDILDINLEWWGSDPSGSNNATTVNTSGNRSTRNINNSYYYRPYLQIDPSNLGVDTGSGTTYSPYVLKVY